VFYGPKTKQSIDLQSAFMVRRQNSPLTSRLATVLLWLLTQALNWLSRGREWKYSTASSADNFSTVPSTRTYDKHTCKCLFIIPQVSLGSQTGLSMCNFGACQLEPKSLESIDQMGHLMSRVKLTDPQKWVSCGCRLHTSKGE